MLTKPDRRRDGSLLSYLDNGRRYRPYDPVLFDWLKLVVGAEKDRRTARLEVSGLLGRASFQSKILGDTRSERDQYFSECIIRFTGCDLVFFDPDNGLETRSTRPGRKGSSKYLRVSGN
jgi:hypothetical protein